MALSADAIWNVQADGSDNNGGGFKFGATGTDRTGQAAAWATLTTASVLNATTNIVNVAAGDYTVTTADVGNHLQITGGTATAGFYEITAVDTGNNRWTLDRSAGTAGQTVAGAMGGALASIHKVSNGVALAKNRIWVKAGTYTRTATTTVTAGSFWFNTQPVFIIGYNTTRGDTPTGANRPIISLSTNTGLTGISITGCAYVANIIIDCNGLGTSIGMVLNDYCFVFNVTVREFTSYGFSSTSKSSVAYVDCEALGGTSAATAAFRLASSIGGHTYTGCWAHDNACTGFLADIYGASYTNCLATNNTGASSDGWQTTSSVFPFFMRNCIAHANGRDGLNKTTYCIGDIVQNNIFTNNGRYGLNYSGALPTIPHVDYNAFRNNSSAAKNNMDSTSGNYNSGPFTSHDVTLSADPYTNAASNDYTLNNNAGGGAACRETGTPGALTFTT